MIKIRYILWTTVLLVIGCKKPNSKSFIGTYNCKFSVVQYYNNQEKVANVTIIQRNDSLIMSYQIEDCSYGATKFKNVRIGCTLNTYKDTLHMNVVGRKDPMLGCGYNGLSCKPSMMFFYKNKLEGRILFTTQNSTNVQGGIMKIQEL